MVTSGAVIASTTCSHASPSGSETVARSCPAGMRRAERRSAAQAAFGDADLAGNETFQQLERDGLVILLSEQNLGVATALAERQLIMVAGTIAAETTASALAGDPELQRRYLGVEPLAH